MSASVDTLIRQSVCVDRCIPVGMREGVLVNLTSQMANPAPPTPPVNLLYGIQLAWHFDSVFDVSNQVYDSIVNYPLVITANGGDNPVIVPGLLNNSVEFNPLNNIPPINGLQEPVAGGTPFTHLSDDRTFSLWFFPVSHQNASFITGVGMAGFDATSEWILLGDQLAKNAQLYIYDGLGGSQHILSSIINGWNHLLWTWKVSTNTATLFVNGVSVGSVVQPPNINLAMPMFIGDDTTGTFTDPSKVDEFDIWSRVLTQAEITSLYNAGAGKAYPF